MLNAAMHLHGYLWCFVHFSDLGLPLRDHSCQASPPPQHRALDFLGNFNADPSDNRENDAQQQLLPRILLLWAVWTVQSDAHHPFPAGIGWPNL